MSKVAAIQMISGATVSTNLDQAERLIRKAAAEGARLLLLPENFALFDSQNLYGLAKNEEATGSVFHWLSEIALELSVWIFAGSFPVLTATPQSTRVRSALVVFSDKGEQVARYDKRHLFDVDVSDGQGSYRESRFVEPGEHLVVVNTPLGRVGLSICYDLRFPHHFWALREQGADIIVVPSAFTQVTGEAHWEVLLRARAIETQCYVIGANQGGRHDEARETSGQSMIVDPWGVVADRLTRGEGVAVADIDRELLNRVRQNMPVLQHRRSI